MLGTLKPAESGSSSGVSVGVSVGVAVGVDVGVADDDVILCVEVEGTAGGVSATYTKGDVATQAHVRKPMLFLTDGVYST